MATTIIQRTIGGVSQNNLAMNVSQFGRLITLPSGWTNIRVGVRCQTTDSAANLTGTALLYLGIGSGTAAMIGDASTTHWLGVKIGTATWTRGANSYSIPSGSTIIHKKVGVTATNGANMMTSTSYFGYGATAGTADRGAYWVDITKGSPNFTVNVFCRTNSGATECSQATFLSQIIAPVPSILNHAAGTATTMAIDEATNGTLNAMQCYWNNAQVNMEFADIAVAVIA